MMSANLVPMVVEQSARGERAFDIFSRLLRDRIVFVNGQIDDSTVALVNAQLLFLESENPERPIAMYINSPGGHGHERASIYDTMQWIRCPVANRLPGRLFHGVVPLTAVRRGSGSHCPIPDPGASAFGVFQGVASDIERHAQDILKTKRRLNEIYARHCGRTYEEVERTLDRDHFMTAAEAKDGAWSITSIRRVPRLTGGSRPPDVEIGLISDTHGLLRPEAVRALREWRRSSSGDVGGFR